MPKPMYNSEPVETLWDVPVYAGASQPGLCNICESYEQESHDHKDELPMD